MIAQLTGLLGRIEATFVVLDVGGVGYKVSTPVSVLTTLPALGGKTTLHIHTNVREDEIALYGFATPDDQKVFEMLIGVTGIGPKVALSVLSALDAESLARTITSEDSRTLTRIPGLGTKTAQRLILELKDKFAAFSLERRAVTQVSAEPSPTDLFDDVVEGLVNLGYNRNDARKAADRALKEIADKSNMGEALRASLNILTGAGPKP